MATKSKKEFFDYLDSYIKSRPTNCDLSDEDIMAEIKAVRYN